MDAHALHSRYDAVAQREAARAAFPRGFERQVDPDGVMEPEERQRRAQHARRAHMARLWLKAGSSTPRERRRHLEEPCSVSTRA
jgi:hypothetical protein